MRQDLLLALRVFRKYPGLTSIALLSLALAVGANTAIFSAVNAVFLKPLPFHEPDRLVLLWEKNPILGGALSERIVACLRNYLEWKQQARSFDGMAAMEHLLLDLTGDGPPERIQTARASSDFFPLLGVQPLSGRFFDGQEAATAKTAVLSQALWTRRFGADPGILGRTLTLSGTVYTVIGVLPPSFHLPAFSEGFDWKRPEIWLPLDEHSSEQLARRLFVFARLKPTASIDRARIEMNLIAKRLEKAYPDLNTGFSVTVFPIAVEDVGSTTSRALLALQIAVGFVLLIACANVANLLLTRAVSRSQEIAVRIASGATPAHLFRQTLTESLILSLAGGLAGIPVGFAIIRLIIAFAPEENYHLRELTLDTTVLSFTFAAAVLSGLVFGAAPALYIARANVSQLLSIGGRSGSSGISHRTRRFLVVFEVALAQVLLIAAGLMIRSLYTVLSVDTGFQTAQILTFHLQLPESRYKNPQQIRTFCDQLLEKLQQAGGVQSAAIATALPILDNIFASSFGIEDAPPPDPKKPPVADIKPVSESYFDALRIPILRGRAFTRQDTGPDSTAVIVNETFARQFFPNESPLGKALLHGSGPGRRKQIVGVAAGTPQFGLETSVRPEIFFPTREIRQMAVMIRTSGDPVRFEAAVTAAVHSIDPDQPVSDVKTLDKHLSNTQAQRRFSMLLFGAFALLALILSASGIYGVLTFLVTQRVREIGVRMALGAEVSHILQLVLSQGLGMALTGVAIGTIAALLVTRLMESLLFGIQPSDPATFLGVGLLLTAVAALSSLFPARRAARVDPVVSLRAD